MARRYKLIIAAGIVVFCCLFSLHEYHRATEQGRRTRLSASSSQRDAGPCFDFHQASSHAGENGCVSGLVVRAFTSKSGNTFLDFCSDYKACPFSSVIFASDRNKFGNLEALAGQQVEIHGFVSTYNSRAEIIIRDPRQIEAGQ
jgi:hypothetical protein